MLEGDALPAAEAARPCFCCGATVPADLRCYCRMCGDARPLDDRCPCGRPSTSMDVRACDAWVARWEPGAPVDRSAHLTSVALDAELALVNDRGGVIAGMSRAIERKLGTLLRERTEARAERDAARQALADAAVQWQRSSADLAGELARLRGIETAARVWNIAAGPDGPEACTDLIAALDAPRPEGRVSLDGCRGSAGCSACAGECLAARLDDDVRELLRIVRVLGSPAAPAWERADACHVAEVIRERRRGVR